MGDQPSLPSSTRGSSEEPSSQLSSWKDIAAYLHRDVSTVQRWEKREAMPVHRHVHDKLGSVYAFREELDAWWRGRTVQREQARGRQPAAEAALNADPAAPAVPNAPTRGPALPASGPVHADSPEGARLATTGRWWFMLGSTLAATLVVTLGSMGLLSRTTGIIAPRITSLAVLPLKDLSGDPAQAYFADGMTEALIDRLSGLGGLRVISRTSVMQLKGTRTPTPEISKDLNVDAVIEGSVLKSRDRVRISARLVHAETGEALWSGSYDRKLGEVLSLQSEVAQAIASRIEVALTPTERARLAPARSVSPEVYESYVKGLFHLNARKVEESVRWFEDATNRDPTFAPAYVGLASAYQALGTTSVGVLPVADAHPKAIAAATTALELDPHLARAHVMVARGHQQEWKWAHAEAAYRRALDIDPNDALTHGRLGALLTWLGRTEEGLAYARRARELDPLSMGTTVGLGWLLYHAREYEEAIRELRTVLAADPDHRHALWFLGFALIDASRFDEAIQTLERVALVWDRNPAALGVLARAYGRAGRRTEALQILDELKQREDVGYVPPAPFIHAYVGLADQENAFAALERAFTERSNVIMFLKTHPLYDALRADARFRDLLRRVGFE